MMLTWTEIPGVYVRCDTGLVTVFDNITAEVVENRSESAVSLRLCNPTPFPARVKVFTESASELRTPLGMNFLAGCPVVPLAPGEVRFVNFLTHSGGK